MGASRDVLDTSEVRTSAPLLVVVVASPVASAGGGKELDMGSLSLMMDMPCRDSSFSTAFRTREVSGGAIALGGIIVWLLYFKVRLLPRAGANC